MSKQSPAPSAPAEPRPSRTLLATKLLIPPPRPNLVPRPRLLAQLNEGLRQGHRFTLVAAPAGFGKTTLVSEWIHDLRLTIDDLSATATPQREIVNRQSPIANRCTWLSLDESDNDPARFLAYLIAALQQVVPEAGRDIPGTLGAAQLPPLESLVALLINDMATSKTPCMLILDDYQAITTPAIHRAVAFLLDNQPPQLHLVLLTRQAPPLPLARLRARGQITQIGEQELRFTAKEAAAFLRQTMGLDVSQNTIAALALRTEGWITGLQLAALSWQEHKEDTGAFLFAFHGDNRYVMDYLVSEVLQRQPVETQAFLCATAILDRLTAPLCDAVTGLTDSQSILEQLEGANLFVVPLDQRREWYRYHRLFAEVLRTMLTPEEEAQLHRRAMLWYAEQAAMEPAIQHGLAYAALSGNFEPAEELVRHAAEETLLSGAVMTVHRWLGNLPEQQLDQDGELATYQGWIFCLNGELPPAEKYADLAEKALQRAGPAASTGPAMGRLLALRVFLSFVSRQDYAHTVQLATQALEFLDPDQAHWRSIVLWCMAESLESLGNIVGAITTLRQAHQIGLAVGSKISLTMVEMSMALALNYHGQRREAVAFCEDAVARHTDAAGRISPLASPILSRLGMLTYEANDLQGSRQYHERSMALSKQMGLATFDPIAQAMAAPTLFAQGDPSAALEALQQAYHQTAQSGFTDPTWILTSEANLRFRLGELPFTRHWAKEAGLTPDEPASYLRLDQHLLYVHLLLAEDRQSEAEELLARVEQFVREHGLKRPLITVHLLWALAAELSGDRAAACEALIEAIQLAAPEDYYRAFLDASERVVALLPAIRQTAPTFVDQLLEHAGLPGPPAHIAAQPLVEPLSKRELEVLGLIAAGLSNAEIADRLVIAIGTVKRHINHIYGKLEVQSRTQAVARARALRILE